MPLISQWIEKQPILKRISSPLLGDKHLPFLIRMYQMGGMLSNHQIERLFYAAKAGAYKDRLSLLRKITKDWRQLWLMGYVNRTVSMGRMRVYWLSPKGAGAVAEYLGRPLKGAGRLEWVKQPVWGYLPHDLGSLDVILDLVESVNYSESTRFLRVTPELHLRSIYQKVGYVDLDGKWKDRSYTPDGILEFQFQHKNTFIYALEYDRKTENPLRFASEKYLPFVKYIKSREYKIRYGVDLGRMLVVTTDEHHLFSLKRAAEKAIGSQARWILLTTRDKLTRDRGMVAPIWHQGKSSDTQTVRAIA